MISPYYYIYAHLLASFGFDSMKTEKLGYKSVFICLDMFEIIWKHCE